MAIWKNIEKQFKDKSGSTAKNRLTIQLSFAIKMLIDFYPIKDYIVLLDCVEDIAVQTIDDADNEKIYLYQIKTKATNGSYTLTSVINKDWLQKLYKHKDEFCGDNVEIALVLDDFIIDNKKKNVFVNAKQNINSIATENLLKIKQAISTAEDKPIDTIDLSNFYFIKMDFHTDTYKQQAKELLSEFLIKRVENAQATKINAFFNLLFNVLDNRFNYELNPEVTDKDEIITKKGYTKTEFKRALNCFVSESIPETTDLFKLLPVNNVSEQKNIASMRSRFLMDMSNNDQPFKKLITIIDEYLNDANSENLLEDGCNYLIENPNISPIYKNEAYLKFALAYRYFNFINGVLNEQVNF